MKKFLILVIIVGLIVAGAWKMGWIGVTNSDSKTVISIDKEKAKEDVSKVTEQVKEAGEKAVEKTKEVVQDIKNKVSEEKKTTTEK